jgi:hypothetical protein
VTTYFYTICGIIIKTPYPLPPSLLFFIRQKVVKEAGSRKATTAPHAKSENGKTTSKIQTETKSGREITTGFQLREAGRATSCLSRGLV